MSLLVSLPIVAVGVARHARGGALTRETLIGTVIPMGLGSIIGAVVGALLVGVVPAGLLKTALGVILIVSAQRTFLRRPANAFDSLQSDNSQQVTALSSFPSSPPERSGTP